MNRAQPAVTSVLSSVPYVGSSPRSQNGIQSLETKKLEVESIFGTLITYEVVFCSVLLDLCARELLRLDMQVLMNAISVDTANYI